VTHFRSEHIPAQTNFLRSNPFSDSLLGIHHRVIRFVLSEIQDHCLAEKLPPITILVVGQRGVPGAGFIAWDVDDLKRGFELVYGYAWSNLENPFASGGATIESIADGIVQHDVSPQEAFSQVRVRGMAQLVFRQTLLTTYGGQCALSRFRSSDLLEAAHIIPWGKADSAQRINPRNGILLSIIHHRFFDLGWLTIEDDYTIATDCSRTRPNSFERTLLNELNGTKLRLPDDERHWPDPGIHPATQPNDITNEEKERPFCKRKAKNEGVRPFRTKKKRITEKTLTARL
jgi:HNH endonuclease